MAVRRDRQRSLALSELLALGELFEAKGWPTAEDHAQSIPNLFERTATMLSRLAEHHRSLVTELLRDYQWISDSDQLTLFQSAWRNAIASWPPSATVIVAALAKRRATTSASSRTCLYRFVRGWQRGLELSIKPRTLIVDESARSALSYTRGQQVVLVYVDDFVGSGMSVNASVQALGSLAAGIPIHVVTLFAQQQGISFLAANNITVFAGRVANFGITSNQSLGPTSVQKMQEIERFLRVCNRFQFGYERSEALVTLTRTPNNTFPVFWTNAKVKKAVWDSPFTRYSRPRRRTAP